MLHNRPDAYDGPSWDDYNAAKDFGVPVYSIGPSSVSMITPGEEKRTKEYFKDLATKDYKSSSTDTSWGGTIPITSADRRRINPYFLENSSSWLKHPHK